MIWGPGTVKPGIVHELGATLDLLPTFLDLAGLPLPDDRVYDGQSLAGTLLRGEPSRRQTVFYYHGEQLFAVRHGKHKLHFTTKTEYAGQKPTQHDPPLLFHLEEDPRRTLRSG